MAVESPVSLCGEFHLFDLCSVQDRTGLTDVLNRSGYVHTVWTTSRDREDELLGVGGKTE